MLTECNTAGSPGYRQSPLPVAFSHSRRWHPFRFSQRHRHPHSCLATEVHCILDSPSSGFPHTGESLFLHCVAPSLIEIFTHFFCVITHFRQYSPNQLVQYWHYLAFFFTIRGAQRRMDDKLLDTFILIISYLYYA